MKLHIICNKCARGWEYAIGSKYILKYCTGVTAYGIKEKCLLYAIKEQVAESMHIGLNVVVHCLGARVEGVNVKENNVQYRE